MHTLFTRAIFQHAFISASVLLLFNVLHVDVFTGLYLFRPDLHLDRLEESMKRNCFPSFNKKELLSCLIEAIKVDKSWIPSPPGSSLYMRISAISTHAFIGVGAPLSMKLYTIMTPIAHDGKVAAIKVSTDLGFDAWIVGFYLNVVFISISGECRYNIRKKYLRWIRFL
jgi:branched-subunit amino acid aminotransferase/4-amino-4-deoxychorismate lyase